MELRFHGFNGAGSILGSLFAMAIAFTYGYSASLIVGGMVYLAAFFVAGTASKLRS